ncbi:MAG: DNA replication/repair protein RecF [Candidatus Dojkabacteria bacterium]
MSQQGVFLKSITIRQFRNIQGLKLDFDAHINYFYAPNGTGKTNVLEAIQCISLGKTLRAGLETEVVPHASTSDDLREGTQVLGIFEDADKIDFSHSYKIFTYPKRTKLLEIHKNRVKIHDFLGKVPSIWFSPESMQIVTASPRSKRTYFDEIMMQLFPGYLHDLRNYNRALSQRNRLLQDYPVRPELIRVWTEQLIQYGANLMSSRKKFFSMVNEQLQMLDSISRYRFQVQVSPDVHIHEIFDEDAAYAFRKELREHYSTDLAKRVTIRGPHKDTWNLLIRINEESGYIDASRYASRGQQRMALIILQLVVVGLVERVLGRKPILLLDDIFSELDEENTSILIDFIKRNNIQCIITGVDHMQLEGAAVLDLENVIR